MKNYLEMNKHERRKALEEQQKLYEEQKAAGLHLDMSRGKPDATQLNLSMDMLQQNPYDLIYTRKGTDVRNYGELAGVDEAKELFAELLGLKMENIIMGGQSSLALMPMYWVYTEEKNPGDNKERSSFSVPCPVMTGIF